MSNLPTSGPLLFDALLLALPLLLLALLAVALWRRQAQRADSADLAAVGDGPDTLLGWSPEATRVLSLSERRAHAVLVQALPMHLILAQVSLARFIKVPTRNSYAEWLRRVGHLCADLVVCDAHSQVIAVVEVRSLRERSVERGERGDRRQKRFGRVLKAAGIPLHVWVENALPSVDEARAAILPKPMLVEPALAAAPAQPPVTVAVAEPPLQEAHPAPDEVIEVREPPSSTWFDDFDSGHVPLTPPKPPPRR